MKQESNQQNNWHSSKNKERLDLLFVNLKVLSKIEEKQKVYTERDELILDDGIAYKQIFLRWFYNENRKKTLYKIKEIIRDGISYGHDITTSENNIDLDAITFLVHELEGALEGIRKLKSTYVDDKTLTSKIEYEMELLDRNITKFKHFCAKKSK